MPRRRNIEQESYIDDDEEYEVKKVKNKRPVSSKDVKYDFPDTVNYKALRTPLDKHGCTDIICTVIFIICILGFIALSVFGFLNGTPSNLILPRDSQGSRCGKDKPYENKEFLLFFDITKCLSPTVALTGCLTPQVCVEKCPSQNLYGKIPNHESEIKKNYCYENKKTNELECPPYVLSSKPVFGRCLPDIIATTVNQASDFIITAIDGDTNMNITVENTNGTTTDLTFNLIKDATKYLKNVLDLKKGFQYAYEDFLKSSYLILTALGIGLVLSFIWILLLRCFVKPIVYISIVAVMLILGFCCYFCISYYIKMKDSGAPSVTDSDFSFQYEKFLELDYIGSLKDTWLALSIIVCFIFVVLALILLFLRKRIQMAVELIKEASKTIASIPSSLFWPIFPFLLQLALISISIVTAVYLASAGIPLYKVVQISNFNETEVNDTCGANVGDYCDPDTFNKNCNVSSYNCFYFNYGYDPKYKFEIGQSIDSAKLAYTKTVEFLNDYQWLPQLYVAFMFFWFNAFVVGLSEMTLAGCFGAWYWTRFSNLDKRLKNKLPALPLLRSFLRAFFLHFGTIAFGSLLIAIVKLIRVILNYIDRKLQKATKGNKIAKFLMTCLKCCTWCLERFIKFLNHNAFIITGVYGYNFCKAASTAFQIILNNVVRFAVVDKLTNFLLFLSKLAITAAVGVASFYFFTKQIPIKSLTAFAPDLHYYFLPIAVIIIGVYIIAKIFFDVFAMCVDTLFISALIDAKINDGTPEQPYFMSKQLRKIMGLKNKRPKTND